MRRFSLRQVLVGIAALAMGLAIGRLPSGSWFDVPLVILSFYFVLSLGREAIDTRRLLSAQPNLPQEQLWGSAILIGELVGTAALLVGGWILAFLLAAGLVSASPQEDDISSRLFPLQPQDLVALTLLVAIGLGSWRRLPAKASTLRQHAFAALAVVSAIVLVVVYWADRLQIWVLVYISVSGVEMAQPPRLLLPEVSESSALRLQRFATGGVIGLALVLADILLLAALLKLWNRPRLRWTILALLAIGLVAECAVAGWFGGPGLRRLSPPMHQALRLPPLVPSLLAAAMTLLAAGAFAWRQAASAAPLDSPAAPQRFYIHEHWLGCLLLAVVAVVEEVASLIEYVNVTAAFGYALTGRPATFIWLAAVIGGLSLAWPRWKKRRQPIENLLPCIDPAQFAVLMASSLILLVASAPIMASVSFSCWFVGLR